MNSSDREVLARFQDIPRESDRYLVAEKLQAFQTLDQIRHDPRLAHLSRAVLIRFLDYLRDHHVVNSHDPRYLESEYILSSREVLELALDLERTKGDKADPDRVQSLQVFVEKARRGDSAVELEKLVELTENILTLLKMKLALGITKQDNRDIADLIYIHQKRLERDRAQLDQVRQASDSWGEGEEDEVVPDRKRPSRNLLIAHKPLAIDFSFNGLPLPATDPLSPATLAQGDGPLRQMNRDYRIRAVSIVYQDVEGALEPLVQMLEAVFGGLDPRPTVLVIYRKKDLTDAHIEETRAASRSCRFLSLKTKTI